MVTGSTKASTNNPRLFFLLVERRHSGGSHPIQRTKRRPRCPRIILRSLSQCSSLCLSWRHHRGLLGSNPLVLKGISKDVFKNFLPFLYTFECHSNQFFHHAFRSKYGSSLNSKHEGTPRALPSESEQLSKVLQLATKWKLEA